MRDEDDAEQDTDDAQASAGAGGEQSVEGSVVHVENSLKRESCVGMGAIIIDSIDMKIAKNPT
ncbi:hypothetical protein QIY50_20045 [Pseudomonas putida]|nr:hypothetical protein QIY50_20045 [Pseudomonas putida]